MFFFWGITAGGGAIAPEEEEDVGYQAGTRAPAPPEQVAAARAYGGAPFSADRRRYHNCVLAGDSLI